MKVTPDNLVDRSPADLKALALSIGSEELARIFDGFWTIIRGSNLISGQAGGEKSSRALAYARAALVLAESAPGSEMEVEAWRMMAYTLNANEQYAESLDFYEKSVSGLERLGRYEVAARTRIGWIGALQMVGRYVEAVEVGMPAENWFKANHDLAGRARLSTNIGSVFVRLDDKLRSLAHFQDAAKIFEQIGDHKALAQVHLNLGNNFSQLDRFEESDKHYASCEELSERLGLTDLRTQARYNRTYLYFLRGLYSDALNGFAKLRTHYIEQGSIRHAGLCDLDEAEIYLQLNLSVDARRLALRAAQTFAGLTMHYEEAKALAFAGVAETQNFRFNEALELFRVSSEKFTIEKNRYWIALLDFYRAEVFFAMRRLWEARSFATAAKTGFETLALPSKVAGACVVLARLALEMGQPSSAARHAHDALTLAEERKLPLLKYSAYAINARVADELSDSSEALRLYKLAANEIEERRNHLHQDDLRVTFLKGKQQVYEALVRLLLDRGASNLAEAYAWCERAKSRGLIDLLSHHLPGVRAKHDDSLLKRINRLHEELTSHYMRTRPEMQNYTANSEEIELKEHELAASLREFSTRDPEYVSLQRASTASIEEIQSALPADATLIEYFIERDVVLAFVISRSQAQVHRMLCTFNQVKYLQEGLRFQLDKFVLGPEYVQQHFDRLLTSTRQHLAELYTLLIAPIAPLIRTQKVIVVPHGRIHYLPFHAFLDGDQYMLDRHTISYAPSGSVLRYCLAKEDVAGRDPLIMGAPDETAPLIGEELQTLRALFPQARVFAGADATRDMFFRQAGEADFIHVAGHAIFRPDNPMFSSFKLSDGWVTALDLYSARCEANLVALSGCKSGVNEISGADDLLGLMRGFLYAGARSLLLTLWAVNDRSTSTLMQHFYSNWRRGQSRAAALSAAAAAVREEYPHPFHWAPFVLVGKP